MRSLAVLLTTISLSSLVSCYPEPPPDLHRRNIIYDGDIANTYDFVIAGGGTAGLVLAARLSEDTNTSVLVLEAGDTGDAVKSTVDTPADTYYQSLLPTSYNWNYNTVPQPNAGNRAIPWARGKILGGCSAINGMYQVRPSKLEVDAWAGMIDNGNNWDWDSQFSSMKKSENFTPPTDSIKTQANILFNSGSHGTSGPIHATFPGFVVPIVGNWTTTLQNIGIPPSGDPDGGNGWGAFIATSSINPSNWTRSYSRSAYIDPLPFRSNLAILSNATVTRIIFSNSSSGVTATGVEYASDRNAAKKTVKVNKEVILAGGSIGSPHMLLLSGVGPKDVLNAAGVPVNVELPGVGQHLQDHISTQLSFSTTADTAASLKDANAGNAAFFSFINSATAYVNTTDLVGLDSLSTFQSSVANSLSTSLSSLVPSTDPTVIEGFKAIYNVTSNMLSTPVGQVEILLSLTAAGNGGAHIVAVQAALQHPFSQGRLYINSPNAFDYPIIDPNYLSNPADTVLLREGLKLARKVATTAPLNSAIGDELSPGPSVASDADWDKWLAGVIGTEFHPSCSCAMLPQSQGGVVDANLKVYGTSNVRVVDASVYPIQFAAHLQAPVYGLAEQASSIIRAQYNVVITPTSSSTTSSAPSASATGTKTSQTGTKSSSATSSMRQSPWTGVLALVAITAVLGL